MEEAKKDFIDLEAITQRLLIIRGEFDGNDKEFSEKTGISRTRLSDIRNNKATLSLNDVNEVIRRCPDLISSAERFVFGRSLSPISENEELKYLNKQEESKQIYLMEQVKTLTEENTILKIEKQNLENKLREGENSPTMTKKISEIKVYYTNNSFETYKSQNETISKE